jgi:hypothetical protein
MIFKKKKKEKEKEKKKEQNGTIDAGKTIPKYPTIEFNDDRRKEELIDASIKAYNSDSEDSIPQYKYELNSLLKKKQSVTKLTKVKIYSECYASESQLKKYFDENSNLPKTPDRDNLIMIGVVMQLREFELGKLLKSAHFNRLDSMNKRDRFIINCIRESLTVEEINEGLFKNNCQPFSDKPFEKQ